MISTDPRTPDDAFYQLGRDLSAVGACIEVADRQARLAIVRKDPAEIDRIPLARIEDLRACAALLEQAAIRLLMALSPTLGLSVREYVEQVRAEWQDNLPDLAPDEVPPFVASVQRGGRHLQPLR